MQPRHLILAAILLSSLGLRSCHLANHLQSPLGTIEDVSAITDIGSFAVWAHKIVDAGDWLCRDTHHSYFDWMKDMAPLAQFLE